MFLKTLSIQAFRNIHDMSLDLHRNRNYVFGENGQGKTNILEAIFILCLARSFRCREDDILIPFDKEGFFVEGLFRTDDDISHRLSVGYTLGDGKRILLDGKRVDPFSNLVGQFPVVEMSTEDHAITNGPPAQRRRFFNILLAQSSRRFLQDLKSYEKVLKQRNRMLSDIARGVRTDENVLTAWTHQFIELGSVVMKARHDIVEELNTIVGSFYRTVSDGSERLTIQYRPNVQHKDPLNSSERFEDELEKMKGKERQQGTSLVGPHRDEFAFMIDERQVRRFGSRGEHKTVIVSLKAAESMLLTKHTDRCPLLLLDDLYAELDHIRGQRVVELFPADSQTFITGTSFDYKAIQSTLEPNQTRTLFWVRSGTVESAS